MPRPQLFPVPLCLLAMFSALLFADAAPARIASKDDPVTLQQAWNPKPDALDIELPMPCGLKMAFRAVAVPGEPGQEFPFMMGLANVDRERRIYGERREGRIAGVFTANDLPIAWRTLLEKSEWRGHTVYLIGKYEVSQAQWDAVMNETCPAPEPPKPGMWDKLRGKKPDAPAGAVLTATAALPVREISFADMQTFLGKYNNWLQQQHKKQRNVLPVFVDNAKKTGFVRLPTETEWEFASRGGMAVNQAARDSDAPFAVGKAEEYAVFAGKSRPTEPAPIGSRLPNPLGLHDTAGNVKELMDNAFQQGGSTGGQVVKGGGFRSDKDGILPGWRDEANRYNQPNDQGFRLVLTGELTASARRMAALNARDEKRATEPSDAEAQFRKGEMFRLGQGVSKDGKEAVDWYRKAAEQGHAGAQTMLGLAYKDGGHGLPNDYQLAADWLRRAAEQGNPVARGELGALYWYGRGVPKDERQGAEWCRLAANDLQETATSGDALAQRNLGRMYWFGMGMPKNEQQAAVWYRKAAEQSYASGQKNLGWMYREGRGVPKNDTQAVYWYRKAAEQGDARARANLGWMYQEGRGVPQDDAQAVYWFRKSAEQGDAGAQAYLGWMYQEGRGVPQDDAQAVYWFRKAVEQGDARAQNNLGVMYADGRGVPKDDAQAVYWYRKAAEQGDAVGQNNLGWMYEHGRGVPKDVAQAVYWYRKAAEQGDENAKKSLRRLGQ